MFFASIINTAVQENPKDSSSGTQTPISSKAMSVSHQPSFISVTSNELLMSEAPGEEDLVNDFDETESSSSAGSIEIRTRYGLGECGIPRSNISQATSLADGVLMSLKVVMDKLSLKPCVTDEHPLLDTFLVLLETCFYVGWKGIDSNKARQLNASVETVIGSLSEVKSSSTTSLGRSWSRFFGNPNANVLVTPLASAVWGIMIRDPLSSILSRPLLPIDHHSKSALICSLENVANFTRLVRSPAALLRAWLRLALMSKCLGTALGLLTKHAQSIIGSAYDNNTSIMGGEGIERIIVWLDLLDTQTDFCLYVKEAQISVRPFPLLAMLSYQDKLKVKKSSSNMDIRKLLHMIKADIHVPKDAFVVSVPRSPPLRSESTDNFSSSSTSLMLHRQIASLQDTARQLRHCLNDLAIDHETTRRVLCSTKQTLHQRDQKIIELERERQEWLKEMEEMRARIVDMENLQNKL